MTRKIKNKIRFSKNPPEYQGSNITPEVGGDISP